MERIGGEAGSGVGRPKPAESPPAAAAEAAGGGGVVKGKSCKGFLFYSSVLRSRSRGPICAGVTRDIPKVPQRMVGEIEVAAIQEARSLSNFKYACVGYSMYVDDKENSVGKREKRPRAQLPVCVGVELLADKRAPPYLKKEAPQPQPRRYKPGQAGDDFLTKFQRNARLVANGVARNLNRVGNYIKDTVGDMMLPDRKRPK